MATIGHWGSSVVFSTSDKKILTFSGFNRTLKGRWSNYDIIGRKPRADYAGPELETITFDMTLDAMLGVRPRTMLEILEKAVLNGTWETLVIGGRAIGSNAWCITQLGETWDVILSNGELLKAKVKVTMQEYR